MNQTQKLLSASLLAAYVLSTPAQAALVETTAPALGATAQIDPLAGWLVATSDRGGRAVALASGPQPVAAELASTAAGFGNLPSSTSLSLWTFITTMRAHQQGDRFVALESGISLLSLAEDSVAPVPLPGALWLLVMGLLGMAGLRFSGQANTGTVQQSPSALLPLHAPALSRA